MNQLWIFYNENYQNLKLDHPSTRTLTIGPELKHSVTIRQFPFKKGPVILEKHKDADAYSVYQEGEPAQVLALGEKAAVNDGEEELVLFLTEVHESAPAYYLGERKEITISSVDQEADVYFSGTDSCFGNKGAFSIIKLEDRWNVVPNGENVYLNGEKRSKPASLQNGDEILYGLNTFRVIEGDLLEINAWEPFETALEQTVRPSSETKNKYPHYRRPPRMIYDLPDDKISFSFPAQESDNDNKGLWLMILPPIVMLVVMGIVAIIQPRNFYPRLPGDVYDDADYVDGAIFPRQKPAQKARREKGAGLHPLPRK